MKNSKFLLVIPAVAVVTLFSIFYTSNAESYTSKSAGEIYSYSDSTQNHDGCCKSTEGCGNMKGSSNHDEMMMKHDKQKDDKNTGEHKHNDDTDVKKDDHSGCMGH